MLFNGPLPYIIFRPAFISGPNREEFRPLERVGAVVTDALFSGLARCGVADLEPNGGLSTAPNWLRR